jgi:transketolase
MPTLPASTDQAAISIIRSLAMDAPLAAKSGHQGTAMALAPLGHVLYSRIMRHDPAQPNWPNRDRFILSNGHASILQYALLFLHGYGLEIDDLRNFRQWRSQTPGHPEFGHTNGVEVTTGPLGQGFANAVGMAIAESHLRARFGEDCFDHHTFVIAGDGCLMEGISHEAASLAGHLRLDHLVCVFDDNRITIDGTTDLSCSDDVGMRFQSYGWNVIDAGEIGEDLDALERVLNAARAHRGAPTLVKLRTHIGFPSPDFTDRHEAHGNPFDAAAVTRTKAAMGIPDEAFWAPQDVVEQIRQASSARGRSLTTSWRSPTDSDYQRMVAPLSIDDLRLAVKDVDVSKPLATRQAITSAISLTERLVPGLLAGSADLTGNTGVKIPGFSPFQPSDRSGRQVYYGIREHAMGAISVGIALHGLLTPVSGTFFVFADYMKPSLRLAALSRARAIFVFSHDSIGVGEDGPTHQPVEQLASLRSIPGLRVIRPADTRETAEAWIAALTYDGPTALILSRQTVPDVTDGSAVRDGAAFVRQVDSAQLTIVATGSEVAVALSAADLLAERGVSAAVVSMPSWDMFEQAGTSRNLFSGNPVLSVEAASTFGWARYADDSVGVDVYGASAPGPQVMSEYGITPSNVADRAERLLKRT